ncbi:MAG: hypothetical protein U9R79_04105 [Armatimonadota bacterium]|nr:hypothetical protein [Armatimonadota bacterium]
MMLTRLILMLVILSATHLALGQENLLVNPGFETGDRSPAGWTFNHRGTDGEIAWDDTRANSGERSVRLTNTEGQTGNVVQTVRIDPPLPPGSRVTYSALCATEEADSAPSIILYLVPESGPYQTVAARGLAGSRDFAEVRSTSLADRPVASIVVYLCHYGTGTAWWDDAALTVERAEPVTIRPRPQGRDLPALSTDDGLSLVMNDAGGVSRVRVGDADITATGLRSGLWVQPWQGDLIPVTGVVAREENWLHQRWEDGDLGLRLAAHWSSSEDGIICLASVSDLTGEDRGVDVIASLPVGRSGDRWGQSIVEDIPIGETPLTVEDLTFSAITGADGGMSLCVPAESPCDCRFGWSPELGYYVRFRIGLSPAGMGTGGLRSEGPVEFVIQRIDPDWGLRDAARRYQQYNDWAFEKRAEREGLWMFGTPRIDLPDPENYAFHEGGPTGWEYDDEHGIATCPYIIPGQREIKRLDSLPASAAEALEIFETWEPQEDERGRGWGLMQKQIIRNCMLHDADGDPVVEIRNTAWGGNSITFPLNANPWLFAFDDDRPTIAGVLLDAVRVQHDETPGLDGTYVDSLGHWGNFVNFRREHFAAERIPLSYDPATGRPVINNRFTLLEFLWELGTYLHDRGKLLFANGVHPNRRFHFFALDVLGVEGHGRLEQKRTMAGPKPFLLLIYNIHEDPAEMERWFNICTHWGIYPSFGNMRLFDTQEKYAPIAELNSRYVPTLRRVTAAGWRPVTHARTAHPEVAVERWGPGDDGELILTVLSSAEQDLDCELRVDAPALGLQGETLVATDLLAGDGFEGTIAGGATRLTVPVSPQRVRVLQLQAR